LPESPSVDTGAFSPDGRLLITGGDKGLAHIWDLEASGSIVIGKPKSIEDSLTLVAFFPDGRRILTTSMDGPPRIWDAEAGTEIAVFPDDKPLRHAVISPDGKWIAAASGAPLGASGNTLVVWSTAEPDKFDARTGHQEAIASVAFSPDSRLIATASYDKTVRLWSAAASESKEAPWYAGGINELAVLGMHTEGVATAAFLPQQRLITVSKDKTVRVWDGRAGGPVLVLPATSGRPFPASFSPDGRQIVTGIGTTATIWDARSGARLGQKNHEDAVRDAAFAPEGTRIVTSAVRLHRWDAGSDAPSIQPGDYKDLPFLTVSADRKRIILGSSAEPLHLWDLASVTAPFPPSYRPGAAAFSPDGTRFVTASGDARIHNAADGKEIKVFGQGLGISSVAFLPDGRLITGTQHGILLLWNAATLEPLGGWRIARSEVKDVAVSPDGRRVVTVADAARMWDLATQKEIALLESPQSQIRVAAFSPDGRQVITDSGISGSLQVWPIFATTQELIDHAREVMPRKLTQEQREQFFLDPPRPLEVAPPPKRP
jgi:WD40 repeat protein